MPAVKLSPIFNSQIFDENGDPAVGWKIYGYAAGSTSLQDMYTTSVGDVKQANPIIVNALGFASNSQIWLQSGKAYKLVLTDSSDVVKKTEDNISGVNDTATSTDEWTDTGVTPSYITANSFSLLGDQTSTYHIGRRVKFQATAGTVYGRITGSVFTSLTTVTVQMDGAQALDGGLSSAQVSILRANILSLPERIASTTGTNTYVASVGIVRIVIDDEYKMRFAIANDGVLAPTLNVDATGALPVLLQNGGIPSAGQLSGEHKIRATSTAYIVLNPNVIVPIVQGGFRNLVGSCTGLSAVVTFTIDELITGDGAGNGQSTRAWNKTITMTTLGAGGIDVGAVAANTLYYAYGITKPDGTQALIASLSAVSPSFANALGYAKWARIGSLRTDPSANKYPMSFLRVNGYTQIKVSTGSNVAGLPSMVAGVSGNVSTPTYTAVAVGQFVPPTATRIHLLISFFNSQVIVAPNNSYGANNASAVPPSNPAFGGIFGPTNTWGTLKVDFALESTNIYYASSGANAGVNCIGWEE